MHLVATRKYPFLATQTLAERQARDSLFRVGENEFFLHMTSGEDFKEERLIRLDSRAALLWISQTADDFGMNWD
jgi:pyocin large subunit-like protein